jgi:hypothetical protein
VKLRVALLVVRLGEQPVGEKQQDKTPGNC